MSNFMIAFFLGLGSGVWIYSKMYNRTGGNGSSAATVAGLGGFTLFLLTLLIMSFLAI